MAQFNNTPLECLRMCELLRAHDCSAGNTVISCTRRFLLGVKQSVHCAAREDFGHAAAVQVVLKFFSEHGQHLDLKKLRSMLANMLYCCCTPK